MIISYQISAKYLLISSITERVAVNRLSDKHNLSSIQTLDLDPISGPARQCSRERLSYQILTPASCPAERDLYETSRGA